MELTNLAVGVLVTELQSLVRGSRIKKIQEITPKMYKFQLHTQKGTADLIVMQEGVFITRYKINAQPQTAGFGAFLNKHLSRSTITNISQYAQDRILIIDANDKKVVIEFFAQPNIILVDDKGTILSALYRRNFRNRVIGKGRKYQYPKSTDWNPNTFKTEKSKEHLPSAKGIVAALVEYCNIPPFVAEGVCEALHIPPKMLVKDISQPKITKIFKKMANIYVNSGKEKEIYKISFNRKEYLVPAIKGITLPQRTLMGGSVNDSLDEEIGLQFLKQNAHVHTTQKTEKVNKIKFSLDQQQEASTKFSRKIDTEKAKADWIYSHFDEVSSLLKKAKAGSGNYKKEGMLLKELQQTPSIGKYVTAVNIKKMMLELDFPEE